MMWTKNIAPVNVYSNVENPEMAFFTKFMPFINHINPDETLIMWNTDLFVDPGGYKNCIVSIYGEPPRLKQFYQVVEQNPHVQFYCLVDIWMYDYPKPDNLQFIEYRQWMYYLLFFIDTYQKDKFVFADQKHYSKKFSSFSFKPRQSRALMTASLLSLAKEQSIISWHGDEINAPELEIHRYLIDSVQKHDSFKHLDWSFLKNKLVLDDNYSWKFNNPDNNLHDIYNAGYQDSLIVLTNETDFYGYHNDGITEYHRPGPYLTEKTWKPLLAGNPFISVAQPHVFEYLKRCYYLDIDYGFDQSYDALDGDFERLNAIYNLIVELVDQPLDDLTEQSVQMCTNIQKALLDPEHTSKILEFNTKQDEILLNLLHQNN